MTLFFPPHAVFLALPFDLHDELFPDIAQKLARFRLINLKPYSKRRFLFSPFVFLQLLYILWRPLFTLYYVPLSLFFSLQAPHFFSSETVDLQSYCLFSFIISFIISFLFVCFCFFISHKVRLDFIFFLRMDAIQALWAKKTFSHFLYG